VTTRRQWKQSSYSAKPYRDAERALLIFAAAVALAFVLMELGACVAAGWAQP
jgi:hypothetical protein